MQRRLCLRFRHLFLILWCGGVTTVLGCWLLSVSSVRREFLQGWAEERAELYRRLISFPELENGSSKLVFGRVAARLVAEADRLDAQLAIFDGAGELLAASHPERLSQEKTALRIVRCLQAGQPVVEAVPSPTGHGVTWTAALPLDLGKQRGVLWIEQHAVWDWQSWAKSWRWHILGTGGLGIGLGFFVAGVMAHPIRRSIERLSKGQTQAEPHSVGLLCFPQELAELKAAWVNNLAQQEDKDRLLRRLQDEYRAVLEHLADGVIIVDGAGLARKWNRQAAQLLRIPPDIPATNLFLPERVRQPAFRIWFERFLRDKSVNNLHLVLDSPEQYLELKAVPLPPARDRSEAFLLLIRDVTRMEVLDRVRRDFVANVSHELKTPLTTIKGFLETLLDGALEDVGQARHFVQIVLEQTEQLERIVDDLLVLTRLEGEQDQPISREKVTTRELVAAAVDTCRLAAERRGMTLQEEVLADVPVFVNPRLFQMALVNLIDNAIKYSEPNRTVRIRVSQTGKEILFSVIDQGWGIEARHLPRIFERFYRVDPGRSRELGGTGLGLSIVKHVAQVHGGRVSVESQVGRGSTFTIHLPLEANG